MHSCSIKIFKIIMTITVGGVDINIKLLVNLRIFIEDHCFIGLCSTDRGGPLISLIENIAKKNRSRFSIAVFLTTLICTRLNDYILFSLVYQQRF